jgi:hypothetical protein
MITFTCPNCSQSLTVPDDSAGKKGKCPQCGNILDIPVTSTPAGFTPPPPPAASFMPPPAEPVFAHVEPTERSRREPPGESVFQKPTLEFVIPSLILGGLAFLGSPGIVGVRFAGVFPAVMMGIAILGLGGFGLTLAIIAMLKAMNQRMAGFWLVLTAVIVSGVAALLGLVMFIAAMVV